MGGSNDLTGFHVWLRLLGTALIGVPALIGAFWGAPLLTREFEDRTYRMVWTQSVTRGRWLATKLAVTGVVTVVVVAVFGLVFTWWSGPIDSTGNRIGTANFAPRGIVPIGYALFGLTLGTLLGTILRRTIPAMAGSLAGFLIVRMFVQRVVRSHLVGTQSVSVPSFGPNGLGGWILSSRTVDAAGQTLSKSVAEGTLIAACHITRGTQDVDAALAVCAQKFGIHDIAQVHTSDQFWALQTAELGHFVDEARRGGHSWTEIGGSLGVTKQAVRKRFGNSVGFPLQSRLQRCLDQAADEARLDGRSEVSSPHLLLGLLREGVASAAMEHLGVTDHRLRPAVSAVHGSAGQPGETRPPMSDEARDAIECAIGLCQEHGGTLVGTEHLFFVLATEVGSRTRKLLEGLGVSLADVKRELACFIEPDVHSRWSRRRRNRQRRTAAK